MLFVIVMKGRGNSSFQENLARRMEWNYPEGVKVHGEYWPQSAGTGVISIIEADTIEQIMAITTPWGDAFKITVSPAITAEDGMAQARQMKG